MAVKSIRSVVKLQPPTFWKEILGVKAVKLRTTRVSSSNMTFLEEESMRGLCATEAQMQFRYSETEERVSCETNTIQGCEVFLGLDATGS